MAEIKPMLLKEELYSEGIFNQYKDWICQIKENGVFSIIHIKDNKIVGIRNRSNNPIFYLYPELEDIKFKFKEGILIAEIAVFRDIYIDIETGRELTTEDMSNLPRGAIKITKSSFYGDRYRGIPGIDQRRSRKVDADNSVTIVAHDILKLDNQVTINLPYHKRYELLCQNIEDTDKIKIAKNYKINELWDKVVKENLEGMVMKNPNVGYQLGIRSNDYIKVKNYKDTEVVVENTEENPKGIKIFGTSTINGETIKIECQMGGNFNINVGETIKVTYLDICNRRLIQPHIKNGNAN